MASSASCIFPVIFRVRRKILRSYLVTSSSNADTSPLLAAATKAGSSSRTTDDGRRFAFGAFTGIRSLPADIASETRKSHELTPVVLLPPSLLRPTNKATWRSFCPCLQRTVSQTLSEGLPSKYGQEARTVLRSRAEQL